MARVFSELEFNPSIDDLVPPNASGKVIIFTGGNNSGKSAYLKKTMDYPRNLYIGVNRFYSFHHLGLYTVNDGEIDNWHQNMQNNARSQQFQNFENSFFNCSTAISRLTDKRRAMLFK